MKSSPPPSHIDFTKTESAIVGSPEHGSFSFESYRCFEKETNMLTKLIFFVFSRK
jgi:hypothetical protein